MGDTLPGVFAAFRLLLLLEAQSTQARPACTDRASFCGVRMIPQIDRQLERWADWRSSFTPGGAYHFRSPLADIRDNRGANSGGSIGPSAPRAWGVVALVDMGMAKLEHSVRYRLTDHQRMCVCLRYTGYPISSPPWKRRQLTVAEICTDLGCHRDAYKELLHRSHARIERYLLARNPLTSEATPPHNRATPARVG